MQNKEKRWFTQGMDGEVYASPWFKTLEEMNKWLDSQTLKLMFGEPVEILVDLSPITEVGEKYKQTIKDYVEKTGLTMFHASWQKKFWEMSIDDRLKTMWDVLNIKVEDSHDSSWSEEEIQDQKDHIETIL